MFWNLVIKEYERLNLHHALLFLSLILYSFLGAFVFCSLESPHEQLEIQQRHVNSVRARRTMLAAFHSIYNDGRNASIPPEGRLLDVVNEYNAQMGLILSREQRWTMWGGLYYAGTIYTTIGYGDLAAATTGGRVATILYALIGVPMVITILNDWGTILFKGVSVFWGRLVIPCCRSLRKKRRKGRRRMEDHEDGDDSQSILHCDSSSETSEAGGEVPLPLYVVVIFFFIWMTACTLIFAFVEGWTLFESGYFFFISLTTIGFGDFTLRHHIAVANFLLILIGLSVVSMTINVIQMQLEALFAQIVAGIDMDFKTKMTQNAEQMRKKSLEGEAAVQVSDGKKELVDVEKNIEGNGGDFMAQTERSMTGTNKLLMKFMSNHQKKMLNEKFEDRNKMRNSATQTSVQIRVASVQTKEREDQPIFEEEEEEEVVTTTTTQDGRIVLTTRLVPKRKMYIYNTGD